MKRFLIVFALLLFVVHHPAAAPPAIDSQGNAAISSFVQDAIARDVPGAVVLVIRMSCITTPSAR